MSDHNPTDQLDISQISEVYLAKKIASKGKVNWEDLAVLKVKISFE